MLDESKNVTGYNVARSLRWVDGELFILDQTRLPGEIVENRQETIEQVWESIQQLKVRGAPAIGVAAAYGLLVGMRPFRERPLAEFFGMLKEKAAYLNSSRPTAVNLGWSLKRMTDFAKAQSGQTGSAAQLYELLVEEACRIHAEDQAICRAIGEHGLQLIHAGAGVLTHCNAGALATSELGTATAPLYLAHARGINFRIYADETRPLLQGARLTTWELQQAGLDVTLICDSMAAHVMSQGLIDICIVGCDRVAANGDAANKIGTLGVAILAQHFKIPFYVACPSSTVDLQTARGDAIVIEERAADEVLFCGTHRTAPQGAKALNPAFDVTPHALIAGFITERGILRPPYAETLARHFG
ncbi:MAG: S-methyl-5-thioribose-1-phosphate isomerase [Betaproteobacteria bacterium]|nr:S-methyl-5-thioribose-1-phosphate isomerase [Betaproteobacteria bacterium]